MRARILQRKDDDGQWFDDCYALENSDGQVKFETNLTWEKIGLYYNRKLQETGVSLDEIETVLMPGNEEDWRWLPVEVVEENESETFLEDLNERCCIPKPRSIADRLQTLVNYS